MVELSKVKAGISRVKADLLYGLSKKPVVRRVADTFGRVANLVLNPIGMRYATGVTFSIATLRHLNNIEPGKQISDIKMANEHAEETATAVEALYHAGRKRGLVAIFNNLHSYGRSYEYHFGLGDFSKIHQACTYAGLNFEEYAVLMSKILHINGDFHFQANFYRDGFDRAAKKFTMMRDYEMKDLHLLILVTRLRGRNPAEIVKEVPLIYKANLYDDAKGEDWMLAIRNDFGLATKDPKEWAKSWGLKVRV